MKAKFNLKRKLNKNNIAHTLRSSAFVQDIFFETELYDDLSTRLVRFTVSMRLALGLIDTCALPLNQPTIRYDK